MFRTILKVIYFAFAFFAAMVGYMVTYQGNIYNVLKDRADGYMKNEEYGELARMFGGLSNSKARIDGSRAEYKNDKVRIQLYEGTTEANYTYYVKELNDKNKEEEVMKSYHAYDKAYFLYMFNVGFTTTNISGNDKELTNKAGISFYNEAGQEFNYLLTNSPTVNKNIYKEKPIDKYESVLYGSRDLNGFANSWDFYSVIIDETLIEAVQGSLDKSRNDATSSPIVAFNITDSEGKKVYSENINFSFSFNSTAESTFFEDTQVLYDAYDELLPVYDKNQAGEANKDDLKKAEEEFDKKIAGFNENMKNGIYPDYKEAFSQKELVPGWVMWKTMGEITLFVILVFVIYMLLFNFRKVANLCSNIWGKLTGKKTNSKNNANKRSTHKPGKGGHIEMRVKPEAMRKPEDISFEEEKTIDASLEEEAPVEDSQVEDVEFNDPENKD